MGEEEGDVVTLSVEEGNLLAIHESVSFLSGKAWAD